MANRTRFETTVSLLPATPMGLLGERWFVEHRCYVCRQAVSAELLVEHAEAHQSLRDELGDPPRPH